MQEAVEDPSTGVILFDVMLGYGSHADMAGALLPAIHALQQRAEAESRTLYFVATVCGTRTDIQEYDAAVQKLQSAGVVVCETNKLAVMQALALIGHPLHEQPKPVHKKETSEEVCAAASGEADGAAAAQAGYCEHWPQELRGGRAQFRLPDRSV